MKTYTKYFMAAAITVAASQAVPAQAGVNFNLSIGVPAVVAAVPPPPPVYEPPRVLSGAAPEFIFSPSLGFYVSVGTPVDVYYTGGHYYRYDRGYWYSSPRYNGHWLRADRRGLPPGLTRYRYEQIRHYRDSDCRHHLEARDHRRGNWRDRDEDDRRGDWRDRGRGQREYEARWNGDRGR